MKADPFFGCDMEKSVGKFVDDYAAKQKSLAESLREFTKNITKEVTHGTDRVEG